MRETVSHSGHPVPAPSPNSRHKITGCLAAGLEPRATALGPTPDEVALPGHTNPQGIMASTRIRTQSPASPCLPASLSHLQGREEGQRIFNVHSPACLHSPTYLLIHSLTKSFIHSLINYPSLTNSLIHSPTHSFTQPLTP